MTRSAGTQAAHELGQFPADPAMFSHRDRSAIGTRPSAPAALQSLDVIGEKTPLTTDPKPVAAALEDESAQVRCMAAQGGETFRPGCRPDSRLLVSEPQGGRGRQADRGTLWNSPWP